MNVCFLIRSLGLGGAERQLVRLACSLSERQHNVTVITYYEGGPLEAELIACGVKLRSLGKTGRWQLWQSVSRLVSIVREERADVLHTYLPTSNILGVLSRPFLRGVRVVAGVRASFMNLEQYDALAAWSYRVERWLIGRADAVICNSRAAQDIYCRHVPAGLCHVVANGIDIARFRPDPQVRQATRAAWGIGNTALVIGIVARIDPVKDYDTFLAAVGVALKQDKSLRFVCVTQGDCPEQRALQGKVNDLGVGHAVHWAGPYDDMHGIYPALDLVTLTSVGEGFPNVIAEAMACGVCCVSTDVGDAAFIIGDTGLVVPRGQPEALASAWQRVLENQAVRGVGSEARQRIVENFSIEKMVTKTESILAGAG